MRLNYCIQFTEKDSIVKRISGLFGSASCGINSFYFEISVFFLNYNYCYDHDLIIDTYWPTQTMKYIVPDPMLIFSVHNYPAKYIDRLEKLVDACIANRIQLLFLNYFWDMLWDILQLNQDGSSRVVDVLNKLKSISEIVPFTDETYRLSQEIYQQYDTYLLAYQRHSLALATERWLKYVTVNATHFTKIKEDSHAMLLDDWLNTL